MELLAEGSGRSSILVDNIPVNLAKKGNEPKRFKCLRLALG